MKLENYSLRSGASFPPDFMKHPAPVQEARQAQLLTLRFCFVRVCMVRLLSDCALFPF